MKTIGGAMKRQVAMLGVAMVVLMAGAGCHSKDDFSDLTNSSGAETKERFGTKDDPQDQPADVGIPIVDTATEVPGGGVEPGETDGRGTGGPAVAAHRPVFITNRSEDLGSCVLGKSCEKKIKAKGGSGKYVWSIVEGSLPAGMELANVNNDRIARIVSRPTAPAAADVLIPDAIGPSRLKDELRKGTVMDVSGAGGPADGAPSSPGSAVSARKLGDVEGPSSLRERFVQDDPALGRAGGTLVTTEMAAPAGPASAVGAFAFTVRTADVDDPANYDEMDFTLTITDTLALDMYTMSGDAVASWLPVGSNRSRTPEFDVRNTVLMFQALGSASSYTWSFGDLPVECAIDQPCYGSIAEGLDVVLFRTETLFPAECKRAGIEGPCMMLTTKWEEQAAGRHEVTVKVADDNGNTATRTVAFTVPAKDPCTDALKITPLIQERTPRRGGSVTEVYKVEGGKGTFTWTCSGGSCEVRQFDDRYAMVKASFGEGVGSEKRTLQVTDGTCTQLQAATLEMDYEKGCKMGKVNSIEIHAQYNAIERCAEYNRLSYYLYAGENVLITTRPIPLDAAPADLHHQRLTLPDGKEACVEDISKVSLWMSGRGCQPTVVVEKMLLTAGDYHAAIDQRIGGEASGSFSEWFSDTLAWSNDSLNEEFSGYQSWGVSQ